ncbi:phosphoinositide phosphatase SAC8 isoform X1 [Gastrolobium bilobum]|uniref:phosphoinositide phosphatase SAC8 isoform X1 n=1 Tax=Gastrolobium bilobum TaxID=150636 RepID=UPI002AB30971|nr:phosphoinositide phosphatase SAC8 isoform X1 [Gastrolobium bilobum]XP_061348827.1 phosphoinositide phosphatase SAC8 isoform X1 [Gastrolobium bilobum]
MDIESSSGSAERFKLYDELELQEFQDKFVIKSHESPNQGFWISRRDGNINLLDGDMNSESPSRTSTIYGVVGTIRLVVGTYAIVITSRKEVGSFLGFPVYRLMSMRVLACNDALRFSTAQEKRDETYFMTLLKIVESMPGLYYSYETDITLNLQRRSNLIEGWMSKPIWKQADPRFVWNKHLLEELIESKLDRFIMPLVQGSFQVAELKLKESCATVTLFSRRCTRRLGTRMWRRGANLEGDTANFIETEQLLEIEEFRSSSLQIRGSIPLLWEQIVDLSYKPHLRVISHEQTPNIVERHFHDLSQRYGEVVAVDLTDKHGEEGQLSAAYAAEMQNQQNVRYVSFDFHHHCASSNFDNLKILYDQILEDFEKQRYFLIDRKGNVLEEQRGIIRANCIDSLDRTNVTQCYLAQKSLNLQLQRIGVLTLSECISMFGEEYGKFRILWAEQGDEISLEYAGTHALKGDLVRYGKQTIAGKIKDGMSAISRYYLNNFTDGIRQDALDLISGHYTVSRNAPSPLQPNSFEPFSKTVNMQYLPVASALIIGGLTATTFTLQQAGRNAQHYVSSVFFAGITAGVMAIVKANGRQLCSRPRLCGLL